MRDAWRLSAGTFLVVPVRHGRDEVLAVGREQPDHHTRRPEQRRRPIEEGTELAGLGNAADIGAQRGGFPKGNRDLGGGRQPGNIGNVQVFE